MGVQQALSFQENHPSFFWKKGEDQKRFTTNLPEATLSAGDSTGPWLCANQLCDLG